jgi:DNA-binding beta-propeller fold protein YncE
VLAFVFRDRRQVGLYPDLRAPRRRTWDMNRREFVIAAAALVVAPDALARGWGGTPVALVTADLESRVVAVHLRDGDVISSIPTLPGPRSIERVGETAVVAHTAHGAVSLLDGPSLRLRRVLRSFEQPRYTAASRDARYAFVTDSGSQSVVVLDVHRGRVVRRLDVGGPARHLSLDPSGRRLWTALGTKAPRIAIIDVRDPVRPRLLGRMRPPFLAHDIGFTPAGRAVWVTSGDRRELALFDPRSARASLRLQAGAPPQHVTFSGRVAFVTSGDDGTLDTHDAATGRLLRTARVPAGSYNVQEAFGMILTPSLSQGTLCVADTRGRLLRRLDIARSSHDACFVVAR